MLERDINGRIIMHRLKNETKNSSIGSIHFSRTSGYFRVIDIDNKYDPIKCKNRYRIKFIDTGYETSTSSGHVLRGKVYDYMKPRVCEIGYLGEDYLLIKNKENKEFLNKIYSRWTEMIHRCYNKSNKKYNIYGGIGITVSKRWHNFSNYYNDIQNLDGFSREKIYNGTISLDKDKLQQNIPKNKMIYSKDTCCWLSREEQNMYIDFVKAHENDMSKFISIKNSIECIEQGIKLFERNHNFPRGKISSIINTNKSYKGYKFKSLS